MATEPLSLALTARQQRELAYHEKRARTVGERVVAQPVPHPDLDCHWEHIDQAIAIAVENVTCGNVLVLGCGFGDDAIALGRLGMRVHAVDISEGMLAIARRRVVATQQSDLNVVFAQMPAESLEYPDNYFQCVFVRDVLHHLDVPTALREIERVCTPTAVCVFDEVYTHTLLERIRRSWLVEKFVYPTVVRTIYGDEPPYITADEKKLGPDERKLLQKFLSSCAQETYFDLLVNRVISNKFQYLNRLDHATLNAFRFLARLLGGRLLMAGRVSGV